MTEDYVTIVSGLPRSGTSMMMQLLDSGGVPALTDNLRRPDEDNPKGYYEFERVKQLNEDTSWLDDVRGKVVKMVYRLLYDLPNTHSYRVVFMRRNLDEVIASQEAMLQRQGKANGDVDAAQLAALYRRQLDDIESWLEQQPSFSVLYVDYHDVLENPEAVVEQLNTFLDGRLDTHAMLHVPDTSLYRQRKGAPAST